MRSTDYVEIHSEVYSTRIEALEALNLVAKGTPGHEVRLHKAAEAIRDSAALYGSAPNAMLFKGLGELLEQVALLADWRAAVLAAESDFRPIPESCECARPNLD